MRGGAVKTWEITLSVTKDAKVENHYLTVVAPTAQDAVYMAAVKTVGLGFTPENCNIIDIKFLGDRQ